MPTAADKLARRWFTLPQPRTSPETPDAATLLPTRVQLFDHLGERMPTADRSPATLVLLGLRRTDDSWPTPARTLGTVSTLVAGSLRGDDWLARSGPNEFAIVLEDSADSAQTAALRLTAAVAKTGVSGLSAAAGMAELAGTSPSASGISGRSSASPLPAAWAPARSSATAGPAEASLPACIPNGGPDWSLCGLRPQGAGINVPGRREPPRTSG